MITLSLLCLIQFLLVLYCLYINRKINIILIFLIGLLFYIPLPSIVNFLNHEKFQAFFPQYNYSEDKIFEILFISNIYLFFFFLGFVIAQSIPAKKFKKSCMIKDEVLATITIIFLFLAVLERYFIQIIPYIKNGIILFILSVILFDRKLSKTNFKNKKLYF